MGLLVQTLNNQCLADPIFVPRHCTLMIGRHAGAAIRPVKIDCPQRGWSTVTSL